MTPEQQEVASLIRSGKYYQEARAWYQVLYIGPVSERSFFIIIALLAVVVFLGGMLALAGFLPLVARPGTLIANNRMDDAVPSVLRIRDAHESMNAGMERYLVSQYVASRESYNAADFRKNAAFTLAHSDTPTAASYRALYDAGNPRSPAAILGEHGQRQVVLDAVNVGAGSQQHTANVKFSTELVGVGAATKTQWTATLSYYYSPMQVTEGKDATRGETTLTVEDPQFQVVTYAVTQTP